MRISDWSSDVCSSDLMQGSVKACPHHQYFNRFTGLLQGLSPLEKPRQGKGRGSGTGPRSGSTAALLMMASMFCTGAAGAGVPESAPAPVASRMERAGAARTDAHALGKSASITGPGLTGLAVWSSFQSAGGRGGE